MYLSGESPEKHNIQYQNVRCHRYVRTVWHPEWFDKVHGPTYPLGDRSVDTDTFARVHSNARTVHLLSREDVQSPSGRTHQGMTRWGTARFSEGPLFRRSVVPKVRCSDVPKVRCSEGSLLRRFIAPKVRYSEIKVHCSENKVQYSEKRKNLHGK